jgi:hypothetical protein
MAHIFSRLERISEADAPDSVPPQPDPVVVAAASAGSSPAADIQPWATAPASELRLTSQSIEAWRGIFRKGLMRNICAPVSNVWSLQSKQTKGYSKRMKATIFVTILTSVLLSGKLSLPRPSHQHIDHPSWRETPRPLHGTLIDHEVHMWESVLHGEKHMESVCTS